MLDRRVLRLGLTVLSLATSACTLRYTQASFDDQTLQSSRKGVSLQGGVQLLRHNVGPGRVDLNAVAASQDFDSKPTTILVNLEVQGRLFPLRRGVLLPYVGGGLGRHRFYTYEEIDTCPSGYICFPGYDNDFTDIKREELTTGYNPHWLFGAEIGVP